MKNRLHILIIILIAIVGCDQQRTTTSSTTNGINHVENEAKNKRVLKVDEQSNDSTIYKSGAASWQVIHNKPDTLIYEKHKVIAYTHFNKFKTDYKTKSIYIDSVEIIEPANAKIVSFHGQNGFTIMRGDNYDLKEFIILNDVNNDGEIDIRIYNYHVSKGSNILYDAFLGDEDTFKHSEVFSMNNLKYDSITNTYSSKFNHDEEGIQYVLNRYKFESDSLIQIEVELQTFVSEKNIYLNKKKDFITGEITYEEIKHER